MKSRVVIAACAALLAAMGGRAKAESEGPNPAAQALFDEGKRLMGEKNYAQACPKLEESNRLAPGAGTKFNLGECYERQGRTASAWATFLSAAAQTRAAGQREREKAARERAALLDAKLSRLAIAVPSPAIGMTITRDEERVGEAQWGELVPVDPGRHTIRVSAPGKRAWSATLQIYDGAPSTKLIVPPLDDLDACPVPAPTPPRSEPAPRAAEPTSRSTLGWVLLGAGGTALVGGAVMWVLRASSISKLETACGETRTCPVSAADDIANGKTYTALGVGLFGLGALGIASGAGLLLLGGKSDTAPRAQLSPLTIGTAQGLALSGHF